MIAFPGWRNIPLNLSAFVHEDSEQLLIGQYEFFIENHLSGEEKLILAKKMQIGGRRKQIKIIKIVAGGRWDME